MRSDTPRAKPFSFSRCSNKSCSALTDSPALPSVEKAQASAKVSSSSLPVGDLGSFQQACWNVSLVNQAGRPIGRGYSLASAACAARLALTVPLCAHPCSPRRLGQQTAAAALSARPFCAGNFSLRVPGPLPPAPSALRSAAPLSSWLEGQPPPAQWAGGATLWLAPWSVNA